MKIYTRVTWDMVTGEVLESQSYDYSGPIALCKKGRESQAKVTDKSLGLADTYQGVQTGARETADPFARSLISTAPGQLSPLAASQYEQAKRNIASNYEDAARTGLKSLSYRGMGGPTGEMASVLNTNLRNRANAETDAYNTALGNTYNQGLAGLNYYGQQQGLYDPLRPLGQASSSAYQQSQMGSTLGDIGQALTTAASVASKAGGMAGLPGCWIAARLWNGWLDSRTRILRAWLRTQDNLLTRLYLRFGERAAEIPWLVAALSPLFHFGLKRAETWYLSAHALGVEV